MKQRTGLFVLLCCAVSAAILIVWWPVLAARAISLDDDLYLRDNPQVLNPSLKSAGQILGEVFTPSRVSGYYQPLSVITIMLDYAAGGRMENPRAFHRTSLALHVANVVLVMLLLSLLFENPWTAAMLGLLFGLHPMMVEPVAWIGERKTVLSTFFALGSLILYVRYAIAGRFRRLFYVGALAACLLAMLAKPTAVPLPLLLAMLNYWPLRRPARRVLVELLPFFVLSGLFAVVTMISTARTSGIELSASEPSLRGLLLLAYNFFFYFRTLLWPVNLTSVYPPVMPPTWSNPVVIGSLIGAVAVLGLALVSLRRTRSLFVGILFFLLAILPTLGLVGWSWVTVSDKYVYLPVIGLMLPLTYGISRFLAVRLSMVVPIGLAVAVLCVAEGRATRKQIAHWQSTESLYQHMLTLAPDSARLHSDMCFEMVARSRFDEAIQHGRRATELKRDYAVGNYNLAVALYQNDNIPEAAERFREAVRIRPQFVQARNNLAASLARLGKTPEAIEQLQAACAAAPGFFDAHYNLASLLVMQGRYAEAIPLYRRALEIQPASVEARNGLQEALAKLPGKP